MKTSKKVKKTKKKIQVADTIAVLGSMSVLIFYLVLKNESKQQRNENGARE